MARLFWTRYAPTLNCGRLWEVIWLRPYPFPANVRCHLKIRGHLVYLSTQILKAQQFVQCVQNVAGSRRRPIWTRFFFPSRRTNEDRRNQHADGRRGIERSNEAPLARIPRVNNRHRGELRGRCSPGRRDGARACVGERSIFYRR